MPSLLPPSWNNPMELRGPPNGMSVDEYRDMLGSMLPNPTNLEPLPLALGLGADDEQFPLIEVILRNHYNNNRLGDEETLDDPETEAILVQTTKEATEELMFVFGNTNQGWVLQWARALLTYMWHAEKRLMGHDVASPKSKEFQESPILPTSVGSGSERATREFSPVKGHEFSPVTSSKLNLVPGPLKPPKRTPANSIHGSIVQPTLEHMTFSLEGFTYDRHVLFPKEEIIATRCVRDGDDSGQVKNYLLNIFIDEFEDALKVGWEELGQQINLLHGRLGYRDPNGRFKRIQKQSEFEVAINHLFNARTSDTLNFQFYQENGPDRRNRELEEKATQRLKKIVPPDPTLRGGVRPTRTGVPANDNQRPGTEEFAAQPQRSSPLTPPQATNKATRRTSLIGRAAGGIRRTILPQSEDGGTDMIGEFGPQPPTPHRLSPPANMIKRALRVQKNKKPVSLVAKVDRFEVYTKKFAEMYRETRIDMYKRGGNDDFRKEVKISEFRSRDREDEEASEWEEEEEPSPDEFMVLKLQRLLTEMDLAQLLTYDNPAALLERWNDCCKLFKINPTKTDLFDSVPVFGLHAGLYQYQAFAVYWQMKTSRLVGGGFVADDPGLGKTLTYLAYIVAERQLSWLWNDVNESRKQNDGRHLREDQQHEQDVCPSHARFSFWIACPCCKSSPTQRWDPKPGVRLAVVPDNLVKSWKEAFVRFVATDSPLDMRCVVANPATCPTPGMNQSGFVNWDSRHRAAIANLKAERNPLDRRLKHDDDTPQPNSDRWLIITTSKYYYTWVKDFEYKAVVKSYTKDGSETWIQGKNPGIVFGIAMIDECHEEWQKGKGRSGVLADLPKLNQPFLWGYSGTPFSDNPRTLEGVLWAIEIHWPLLDRMSKKTGWEQNERMAVFCHKIFDKLCKDFQAQCKSGRRNQEFVKSAERVIERFKAFLRPFMLRRTAEASWFGRPLVQLRPHLHSDIWLQHNDAFDANIKRLEEVVEIELVDKLRELEQRWEGQDEEYKARHAKPNRLTFNTSCRVRWRVRIIAIFPYLVLLAAKDHKDHLNLTTEEFVQLRGKEKSSPYFTHLKQIVESSPKCMWLHGFINRLIQEKDIDGNEQKLVIITNFNPVALIIKLFIEKYVKDKAGRVGALYAGMKQRERNEVIDAFTDALDEKGNRKQKHNYQFLVGTTRFLSTGLQLTRACNVVLMEPDFEYFHELQGYARVHRIGQKNLETFSYRLLDEDCGIERAITYRQANRNEFPGRFHEATVPEPKPKPKTSITEDQWRLLEDVNTFLNAAGYSDLDIDSNGGREDPARESSNAQNQDDQEDTRSTITEWPQFTPTGYQILPFTPPHVDTPQVDLNKPLPVIPRYQGGELTPDQTPRSQLGPRPQSQEEVPRQQPGRQPQVTPSRHPRHAPRSARHNDPAPNWPIRSSSLSAATVPAQRYSDLLTPAQSELHDILLNEISSQPESQTQNQPKSQAQAQTQAQKPNEPVIADQNEDHGNVIDSFPGRPGQKYTLYASYRDHVAVRSGQAIPVIVKERPFPHSPQSMHGSLHSSLPSSPRSLVPAPQTSTGRLKRVEAIIGTEAASPAASRSGSRTGSVPEGGERVGGSNRTDRSNRGPSFI